MHALPKLLLDLSQLSAHALADRRAPHREPPNSVPPADVLEAQKVECFRLAFPSSFPVLLGKPAELDPTRFIWMELQPKLSQSFPKVLQKTIGFRLVLES